MAERRRRFLRWLLPKLIIFAVGVALGYYARDRQETNFQELYEQTRTELEELKERGEDVVDAATRAGEAMKAAADSTKAAVEEIGGEGN
ncbi:MAG: hypothetical protein JSV86_15730 [Gemmatimonadota bacterium]|nr:MAG: hypothetical protein JSV86_15730 [Gemmatimonadota bacterium]